MIVMGRICAWLAFVLLLIFCIKPILRKTKKFPKLRVLLIKQHNTMGILFILFTILHICLSRLNLSTLFGKLSIVCIVISISAYFFKTKLKKNFLKIHGIFALISLLLVVGHIVETNFYFGKEADYELSSKPFDDLVLNDGSYLGSALGYNNGTTVVQITIENSSLTDIKIISTDDNSFYINRVENTLKGLFLSNQSSDVDIIAGCTLSSNGYINAILDAVEKAK